MDRIINYLLLVIIFVFDPLAISLVIAANFAFAQLKAKDMTMENNTKEQQKEALVEMMKTDEEAGLYEEKPLEVYGEKAESQTTSSQKKRWGLNPQT